MNQGDHIIRLSSVAKCYEIYDGPRDRLKQFILPRLQRLLRRRVVSYYREFWALKSVSLDVQRGEVVGVIGKNGSGKSTLLQIICGTIAQTLGQVDVRGRVAALLELGSGFNAEFTGRENIYLNAALLGLKRGEVESRMMEIIEFADIGEFIDRPVKTYSSGMFVRLAFSIQICVDPDILIVDEALAVGDAYFVHKCMQRLHSLRERGVTLFFVSHDASLIKQLCTKAVWMHAGEVREVGEPSRVVDNYLAWLFGGKVVKSWSESATIQQLVEPVLDGCNDAAGIESEIPNIDRRLGDQTLLVKGVSLRDEEHNKVSVVESGGCLRLRATLCNGHGHGTEEIVFGYILRNHRGIELASTNNVVEKFDIGTFGAKENLTLSVRIRLPQLQPGSYAICIAAGYVQTDGVLVVADRVDNAIVFEVTSEKFFNAPMIFDTSYSVEGLS